MKMTNKTSKLKKAYLCFLLTTVAITCKAKATSYVVPFIAMPFIGSGVVFLAVSFFKPFVGMVFSLLLLVLLASLFFWSDIANYIELSIEWFIVSALVNIIAILICTYLISRKGTIPSS